MPIQCFICKNDKIQPIQQLDGGIIRYFCEACTVVFVWPLPDRTRREALYNEEYYTTGIMRGYQDANLWHHFFMMRLHLPESLKGRRMLDIGCATGQYLIYAKEMGMEAEGIDISSYSVDICRQRGLDARCGTLDDLSFPEAAYDWIIARDVMEHVTDPLKLLEHITALLAPGGFVSIFNSDINYLREPEVVRSQNPDEHPFLFDYALLARQVNRRLNIKTLERFKILDNNPHGFRVLITAGKPMNGGKPAPWLFEEPPRKHYCGDICRINLDQFHDSIDSQESLRWLVWRTGAVSHTKNFMEMLSERRPMDTIDLIIQESVAADFSNNDSSVNAIQVPDGRFTMGKLPKGLMEELKDKKYDMVIAITRTHDASSYENIIEILDLFQDSDRILFNMFGHQIMKSFRKGAKIAKVT